MAHPLWWKSNGSENLARIQRERSPDDSLTNTFTGMVVIGADNQKRAGFKASSRAQEDGTPASYTMSLDEVDAEISRFEDKIATRPVAARIEKLNLPQLQAARARLAL